MQYDDILDRLKILSDPEAVAGMARFGISAENTYGISIPNLRKIARETGIDHVLARQLWESGIHEARILASMIDAPKMVTEEQMEEWAKEFDSWDVCDQCCMNLFEKKAEDRQFEDFFPMIKREASDSRNFVKKAVNWALRQIGKRNINLNGRAIEVAEEIQKIDSGSAKWVASDAIRELTSEAVRGRLQR